ncbi:TPA: hypothetical protein MHT90_20540 [Klebsiella pneumoniae]|nr:hypothetical protein [Klebsiella pneumoniae]
MFALLLLSAWLRPCAAQGNELVMATTFSPSATVWIIDRWQKEPGSVMIRTLNRTSASLEQLLDTANAENVDLILTSSPMLLQHLQEHQKLAPFSGAPAVSQHLVPESIRSTSVAVAISGFGLLMNRSALMTRHLPAPADWDDLTDPRYQGALLMSSPSRSDTNHLMVESLLQQKGWIKGWETLLTTAGNLVTISSRSFGVADKIKSGLGVAGPVIDNYANLLLNDPHLAFSYFPQSAVSPTYVAVLKNSQHASEAIADNGPGWPAALLPSLLKPFTTSKTVGLGIGLSICVSLMTQMEGALRLASTFTRSACVVLEFNLTDVKDVE